MTRRLTPELLDSLPPDDPLAVGSRRDLARINALMGNARIVVEAMGESHHARVLELGAGDGREALRRARCLSPDRVRMTLLDLQPVVPKRILEEFRRLACQIEVVSADAFDFLETTDQGWDVIVANLFLHHFEEERLRALLALVAARCNLFVACEPARTEFAHLGSRALWMLGCNAVTRHDARVSVEAGFCGRELQTLWPSGAEWILEERRVPPFSHLFRAERRS